jgi:hypothetical protein
MLASAPGSDESRIESGAGGLCGDFARGQRGTLPSHPTPPCDFATGLRHRAAASISGDFATGMRSAARSAPAIRDFATGQRRDEIATGTLTASTQRRGWRLVISVLSRD